MLNPSVQKVSIVPKTIHNVSRHLETPYRRLPVRLTRPREPEENIVWSPPGELYEKNDGFILRFELPDLKPEDTYISIAGDTLTIQAEHNPPEDLYWERPQIPDSCYGTFCFSMKMPVPVISDKVAAHLKNGILEICLPKAGGSKPKLVKVKLT